MEIHGFSLGLFLPYYKFIAHHFELSTHSGLSKMKTFKNPLLQLCASTGTLCSDLENVLVHRKYKTVKWDEQIQTWNVFLKQVYLMKERLSQQSKTVMHQVIFP